MTRSAGACSRQKALRSLLRENDVFPAANASAFDGRKPRTPIDICRNSKHPQLCHLGRMHLRIT
jgi:hypothetical protein